MNQDRFPGWQTQVKFMSDNLNSFTISHRDEKGITVQWSDMPGLFHYSWAEVTELMLIGFRPVPAGPSNFMPMTHEQDTVVYDMAHSIAVSCAGRNTFDEILESEFQRTVECIAKGAIEFSSRNGLHLHMFSGTRPSYYTCTQCHQGVN